MLKRHALFGCLVFVGLFFVAGQASAKSFNDAATGNWNDGATWGLTSPGVEGTDYPGTNDRAVIDSHTVTMTGNQSVASTTIAGGTLTMSSNTLTVSNLNGSGTVAASTVSVWAFTSGTFNADTGKVTLTGGGTVADTTTFNQLEFGPTAANRTYVITSGKTLTVNATTTISGTVVATINTGTIDAKGDINITNTGVATSLVGGGTATITLTGTENQIVTGSGTTRQGTLPKVTINRDSESSGKKVYFKSNISLGNDFTFTVGTVDATTYNSTTTVAKSSMTINSGNMPFNDLVVDAVVSTAVLTITGTADVNGSLTITAIGTINTGTTTVAGNVIVTDTSAGGTAAVTLDGTGAQSINVATDADLPTATTTINKASGTASLAANLTLGNGGSDLTVTSGTLDLAGYNLVLTAGGDGDVLTVGASGTLQLQGGETVTASTVTLNSGSTVIYNATSGTRDIKDWTYSNLTINGAGGTFTSAADETVGINLAVPAGTLDISDDTFAVNNNLTISGGTLTAPGSSDTLTVGGNWSRTSGTFTHNSGTVTLASSSAQTLTGETFNNLTINNTATSPSDSVDVDSSAAVTVAGTLTVTDGQFQPTTASDFNVVTIVADGILKPDTSAAITASGNWANSGTFTSNSGTVTFDGSGDITLNAGGTDTGSDFDTLRVNKSSGTLSLLTNALDVDTLLRISGGTFSPGALDTTAAALTVDGGTLTGGSGALDVNGVVTVSSGTLTAPSGTFTVSGNWEKTGGTFTSGSNTVTFDSASTGKTISSDSAGFHHLIFNGGGGGWTLVDPLDVNGNLTITAGTLNDGSTDINLAGNFSNSGTFTAGGTLIFDGSSGTQTLNGGGSSPWDLSHTGAGTFQLATNNLTVAGAFTNSAGTFDANGLTATVAGLAAISGGTWQAKTGTQTFNGGLTISGGTFTGSSGTVDVNGAVTLSSGTLTAPSGAFTVSGNWAVSGSPTFTPGTGTVTFDGTNQTISGSTSFYNLTKAVTAARTLTFTAATTQTVTGALTLNGTAGNLLSLRSSTDGTQWNFDPQGTRTISYVDVKDSKNTNGTAIDCVGQNCTDSGNNTNWTFTAAASAGTAAGSSGGGFGGLIAPAGGFRVIINGGLDRTTQNIVRLDLNGGPNTKKMTIANRPDFRGGVTYNYQPTIGWDLCWGGGACPPAAYYTVYVRFETFWGVASDSVSDSIIYWPATAGPVPTSPAPAPISPTPSLLERIPDAIDNLIPDFLKSTPEPRPAPELPVEELIPKETPLAFLGQWDLISRPDINRFVFAPLPTSVSLLAARFPALRQTLADVGVTKLGDLGRLQRANLSLSTKLGDEFPENIVFARGPAKLINYDITLNINDRGDVEQRISTIAGKTLHLEVKPEHPVKSVDGYLVLKGNPTVAQKEGLPLSSLVASPFFARPQLARTVTDPVEIERKLVLNQFVYNDEDGDGIYTALVAAPQVAGEYEVITVMNYVSVNLGRKEIRLTTVVDPEGYVYESFGGKETRIPGAVVSLNWLNPQTIKYELWPAKAFQQANPQVTDVRGTYSFLVPAGNYYVTVTAPGYGDYEGAAFAIEAGGNGVHTNIELKSKQGWLRVLDWKLLLLVLVIVLLLYNFYRDKIRELKPRKK